MEIKTGELEALLYAAPEPVSGEFLQNILKLTQDELDELVKQYREVLDHPSRGLYLSQTERGYSLVTKSEHAKLIRNLAELKSMGLSRAALETLAIVSFRQPVEKREIDLIRGIQSDQVLQTLSNRGLIEIYLEEKEVGRPKRLVQTTQKFLFYFGLTREFEMEQHFRQFLSPEEEHEQPKHRIDSE